MIVYLERLEPLFDMDTGIGGQPTIHSLRNLYRSAFIDDGSGEERVWCDFGPAPTGSLLSMVKAAGYPTARQGRKRRTYDKPRTVYQRLLDLKTLDTSGGPGIGADPCGLESG